MTIEQMEELLKLTHEAFCRGYDRGRHDSHVELGAKPVTAASAPWSVAEVKERFRAILFSGGE